MQRGKYFPLFVIFNLIIAWEKVDVNKLLKVHFLFTFLPLQVGENMQKNAVFDAWVGGQGHSTVSQKLTS